MIDQLTELFTANSELAQGYAENMPLKCSESVYSHETNGFLWRARPRAVATHILKRFPDSYFSAALARVADVGYAFGMHYDRHEKQFEYFILGDGVGNAWFGRGFPEREALQALWLAVLAKACEPCEKCGGKGTYKPFGDIPASCGSLLRSVREPCPDCTDGHAMKNAQAIIDALVGGDTND